MTIDMQLDIRNLMVAMATQNTELAALAKSTAEGQEETRRLLAELVHTQKTQGERIEKLEKWQAKVLGAVGLVILIVQFI